MKLMIIESPNKIAKLQAILGQGWEIVASTGHIRDLPENEIGVQSPDFIPNYQYIPKKPNPYKKGEFFLGSETRVKRIKEKADIADMVYLATDPDREGESISWHLQQSLGLKTYKRVSFNEITESAVNKALENASKINVNLVAAQEARRVLDRLVGYMVSPVLSEQSGEKLSAGRVQSPAVLLVVLRERAIRDFKVTNHFGVKLNFADAKTDNPAFDGWYAEWQTKPTYTNDEMPYFMDKLFAMRVAATNTVEVVAYEESEAERNPPAPFTTSTLQQAASVTLNLEPKATMDAAQNLFAQGHITYHRTDNPNLSPEAMPEIALIAKTMGVPMVIKQRIFKAPEGAQAGHPAITPTHWDVEEAGDTDEQRMLYRLIRLRAIACQLMAARYAVRSVTLKSLDESDFVFMAKGRTLIDSGWLKLVDKDQADDEIEAGEGNEAANPIPDLVAGQVLNVANGVLLEKKTKPPSRYTKASLIRKLESEGIGRPATYAAIMDNIEKRGYVENKGKLLAPTQKGEYVIDALLTRFSFVDLSYTRTVEKELDLIANGEGSYKSTITHVYENLKSEISKLQVVAVAKYPCPECGKPLRRIQWQKEFFWGCSGHPVCTVSFSDKKGEPAERKIQEASFACKACNRPLVHHKVKGKGGYDFWGCSGFRNGCKTSYENKNNAPDYEKAK